MQHAKRGCFRARLHLCLPLCNREQVDRHTDAQRQTERGKEDKDISTHLHNDMAAEQNRNRC